MSELSTTIKPGDTLVWLARPNTLGDSDSIDSNWVCRAGLFDSTGAVAIAVQTFTQVLNYEARE